MKWINKINEINHGSENKWWKSKLKKINEINEQTKIMKSYQFTRSVIN